MDKCGLKCFAVGNHLNGQRICDSIIDERHKGIVPSHSWGNGKPAGVRQRAATLFGVSVVTGVTGSIIWHLLAGFPPVPPAMIDAGFKDFADRWNPILDVFDQVKV